MKARMIVAAAAAALLGAGPVAAQGWESPTFFSPSPPEDIGVFLTMPDGGDVGFMGIWRQGGSIGLGVRAGFTEFGDAGDILLGAEFYGGLGNLMTGSAVQSSWYSGVGAIFGDVADVYRIPLGLSIGMPLGTGSVRIVPYVLPRVTLDFIAYDDDLREDDTDTEVDFAVDLGADVDVGERLILKAGATLTGDPVFGLGITWRMTRGIVVR